MPRAQFDIIKKFTDFATANKTSPRISFHLNFNRNVTFVKLPKHPQIYQV